MSTLIIELPEKLKDRLKAEARRLRKRPARIIREALEARLGNGAKPAQQTLYDLSPDLCGSVSGGPRDLARDKKYLKGYGSCQQ